MFSNTKKPTSKYQDFAMEHHKLAKEKLDLNEDMDDDEKLATMLAAMVVLNDK